MVVGPPRHVPVGEPGFCGEIGDADNVSVIELGILRRVTTEKIVRYSRESLQMSQFIRCNSTGAVAKPKRQRVCETIAKNHTRWAFLLGGGITADPSAEPKKRVEGSTLVARMDHRLGQGFARIFRIDVLILWLRAKIRAAPS
jgi:hypothetical protein